jgi:hypothetical protein
MQDGSRWPETGWVGKTGRSVQVDMSQVKSCAKCHRSDVPVYRHHKGYDSLLGEFNRGIATNYGRYLDCVPLCFDHHCEIHFIYVRYTENWVNHTASGARIFRRILIGVCDDWLAGKIPTPSIPKAFVREFKRSLAKWERNREK